MNLTQAQSSTPPSFRYSPNQERASALVKVREREARFLEAWKRAVRVAGPEYFEVVNAYFYEFASKKDQLRPNYRKIRSALSQLPTAQGLFLCALYALYNEDEGRVLTSHFYPSCTSLDVMMRLLSPECREILQTLAAHYTDW